MQRRASRQLGLSGKLSLAYSLLIVLVAGVLISSLYLQLSSTLRRDFRDRLQDILSFAAPLIDGDYHSLIVAAQDQQTPFYGIVAERLQTISRTSPVVSRISTLRRQPAGGLTYVFDYLPTTAAPNQLGAAYRGPLPAEVAAGTLNAPLVEAELASDEQGRPVLRGFAPILDQAQRQEGMLLIEVDAAPILAQEARTRRIAAIEFGVMLLLALPLGFLLTRRLTAPVAELLVAATQVAGGDLRQTVRVRGSDELGELALAFNTMAGSLQERIAAEHATQDELRSSNSEMQRLLDLVRDLETPVIPLLRGVLVAPLVGYIDARRAGELTQMVLQMVHQHRAQVVLIDVTGISVFDSAVAQAIQQLAQSIQLLGARAVVTGISAEVAQTLVRLNLDFGGIQTAAKLEDGVAAVLATLPAGGSQPARWR